MRGVIRGDGPSGSFVYSGKAVMGRSLEDISLFSEGIKMLSKIPIDLGKIKKDALNKEILRSAIIAELDAINLYEQMAEITSNAKIRRALLDIAKEEKTHVGEFQTLLLIEDREQVHELEEGKKEVRELLARK
jgi:rubrerythrin